MKNFNNRLRNERKKRNMTQREFSKIAGISVATISDLERGHQPSEATILKVAKGLQWTDGEYADYALGISEEEKQSIIQAVELNMERLGITELRLITAQTYRKWKIDMTPYAKRELLKFARMDKEAYERAVIEHEGRNNEPIPITIDKNPLSGEQLKELRTSRGWTQFKLSEKIGIDPSAIPKWESGDVAIPKKRIKQLYLLFDLPYDEVKREYKTEAQRKQEHIQRKELLEKLDTKYERLSDAPEDCELLNAFRELVGA